MADKGYHPKEVWNLSIHIALCSFIYSFSIISMNSCTENIAESLEWGDDVIMVSVFTTIFPVGAMIGALVGVPISEKIGIRSTILIFDILTIISNLLCIIPSNLSFGTGRLLAGIVGGVFITTSVVFINEITPDPMTGPVGTIVQQMNGFSLIFSYSFGLVVPAENLKGNEWNWLWALVFVVPIIVSLYQFIYFIFVYKFENPAWLLKNGKAAEARNALKLVYKENEVDTGIKRLTTAEEAEPSNETSLLLKSPSFCQMFFTKRYRKMMRIALALNIGQQTSGSMIILLYSTSMFEDMGGDKFLSRVLTYLVGFTIFISGLVSIFLLKRIGRKTILVAGTCASTSILFLLGLSTSFLENGILVKSVLVFSYLFFFVVSMGATFWTYIGEVCSDKAVSIGLSFNFLTIIILSFSFPIATRYLGVSNCFYVFSLLSFLLLLYILIDVFETKGLTKHQIMSKVLNN